MKIMVAHTARLLQKQLDETVKRVEYLTRSLTKS